MKKTLLLLSLLAIPALAFASGPHPRSGMFTPKPANAKDSNDDEMKPAQTIEDTLPAQMNMSVGEKRSFKNVGGCASAKDAIARAAVNDKKIMTVKARSKGKTLIFIFGTGKGKGNNPDLKKPPQQITVEVQ